MDIALVFVENRRYHKFEKTYQLPSMDFNLSSVECLYMVGYPREYKAKPVIA
jgi:hypothetical protein